MRTLHVVDGESTGGTLRLSGLAKRSEILRWQDALYTGPVPAGLTLGQLSRVRSRFWTKGKSTREFVKRDAALRKHGDFDEIVLWFGSGCSLCELSVTQLLSWFREQGVPASRLFRVPVEGGEFTPAQMVQACTNRQPVSSAQLRIASRVWKAFRSPSPMALALLAKPGTSIDPGLVTALNWLCAEYPSAQNGLSRLENELLDAVESRGEAQASVAVATILVKERVGDTLLFDMLRNFISASHPLLRFSRKFSGKMNSWQFNSSTLAPTETGRRVLAGDADHIALNGIERWIGGVHLCGSKVRWRWDQRSGKIALK